MLSKQQQLGILCGSLAVVVLIGVIATVSGKKKGAPVAGTLETAVVEEAPSEAVPTEPETETAPVKKPTTTSKPAPTYEDIVEQYKASGYRFQFSNCSGLPGSMSIKQGMKFMMDNRDATSHAFVVGSQKFTIGGYGYKIVTASQTGTHNITCDGRGSATLKVQP